ncbi:polymorphic toxin-type HINT domain-containing protein [Actinomadura fulvescens]|uniref:Hint domain-containing protein n=1 Tax=Actinomadura fulvescens TaxID=46160 RepID=A0ABP6CH39_9ACTN
MLRQGLEPTRPLGVSIQPPPGQAGLDAYRQAYADAGKSVLSFVIDIGGQLVLDVIGYNDAKACFTRGDIVGCLFTALNALGPLKLIAFTGKLSRIGRLIWRIATGIPSFRRTVAAAQTYVRKKHRLIWVMRRLIKGCSSSFVPNTRVLMADASRRRIDEVRAGDRVLATDPKTGKTASRRVLRTITSRGEKRLVAISAHGAGPGASVTATDEHPFWVAGAERRWVKAKDLELGMWLRTSTGVHMQVKATRTWTTPEQQVHNLTIAGIPTYYVELGVRSALVHNCGANDLDPFQALDRVRRHVFPLHGPGTEASGSKFSDGFEVEDILNLVFEILTNFPSDQTGNHRHLVTLDRVIGQSQREGDNQWVDTRRVVLRMEDGELLTVHPTLATE